MSSGISYRDLLTMLSTQVHFSDELLSSLKTCNTLVIVAGALLKPLQREARDCINTCKRYLKAQQHVKRLVIELELDRSYISTLTAIRDKYLEVKAIAEDFKMTLDKCEEEMNAEWEEMKSHLKTKELGNIERMAVKHPGKVIEKLEIFNKKATKRKISCKKLLVEWKTMKQDLDVALSACAKRFDVLSVKLTFSMV